LLRVKKSLSLS